MKLRARARFAAWLSSLAFAVLIIGFLFTYEERTRTEQTLAFTESLTFQITQLRTALFGFLVHPQAQPCSQVETQFEVLRGFLEQGNTTIATAIRRDTQTRYAWENLGQLVADMLVLFNEFSALQQVARPSERDQRTIDLVLVKSHALVLFVNKIQHHASAWVLQANLQENLALGLLLAGMAFLMLFIFVTFKRTLLNPLAQLHATVMRVAEGATVLRVNSQRRDEVGELANAFDYMLDQLQITTVSRDHLEAEIAEHQHTEVERLASVAMLEAALSSMTDAVCISNLAGQFLHFNDAFATFHKFRDKVECAKTLAEYPAFLDILMADGRLTPLTQWPISRALRGETVSGVEYSIVKTPEKLGLEATISRQFVTWVALLLDRWLLAAILLSTNELNRPCK